VDGIIQGTSEVQVPEVDKARVAGQMLAASSVLVRCICLTEEILGNLVREGVGCCL
jgi:hypothetical protein